MNQTYALKELYQYLVVGPAFKEQEIQFFFEHNVVIVETDEVEFCRVRYNTLTKDYEFMSLVHIDNQLTCTKEPAYILDIERKILEMKKRIS